MTSLAGKNFTLRLPKKLNVALTQTAQRNGEYKSDTIRRMLANEVRMESDSRRSGKGSSKAKKKKAPSACGIPECGCATLLNRHETGECWKDGCGC